VASRPYYAAKQIAGFLGVSMDSFYKRPVRERYYTDPDIALPRPYCAKPLRFDRSAIDAWRGRFHPALAAMAAPANDRDAAPPGRDALARHYAARRGA